LSQIEKSCYSDNIAFVVALVIAAVFSDKLSFQLSFVSNLMPNNMEDIDRMTEKMKEKHFFSSSTKENIFFLSIMILYFEVLNVTFQFKSCKLTKTDIVCGKLIYSFFNQDKIRKKPKFSNSK